MNRPDLAEKRALWCGSPQGRRVTTTDSVPATQADVRLLSISAIREDGQTQHRVALDPSIIAEYASLMREGVTFPPVRVWWQSTTSCPSRLSSAMTVWLRGTPAWSAPTAIFMLILRLQD